MYRYHLIASFDKSPDIITAETDESTSTITAWIQMLNSAGVYRYGLQTAFKELSREAIYPSESGIDVIIFGLMVYIADMKISRREHAQDSWSREIWLTVPVFDDKWNLHRETFERMLRFLTGDLWKIEFLNREVPLAKTEHFSERTDKYKVAQLFSGGMDSLIAAINRLEQREPTLLVSHAAESRVRSWQTNLITVLDDVYGEIPHANAYYWTTLKDVKFPEAGKDMNQRSRSFLFIAIAFLAMSGTIGCKKLFMPENGLIALNVPLEYLRIGSHSTRTTHPFYLRLWNEVATDIFGFEISNPYWNKTKGEMTEECLNKDVLMKALPQSFSCSSVNNANIRSKKSQHCGHCLPCIIRRAAVYKAFDGVDPSDYMYDKVKSIIINRGDVGEQIRSFQYAIARIKDNKDATKVLIHKPGALENDELYLDELASVYYRGLMEVDKWINDSLEEENAG